MIDLFKIFLHNKSRMAKAIIISIFMYSIVVARAEYRVYQYYVRWAWPKAQDAKSYLVTSVLSPTGYLAYHGGPESIQIDLIRTWMCPGHTGLFRPLCASPYENLADKLNTANEDQAQ